MGECFKVSDFLAPPSEPGFEISTEKVRVMISYHDAESFMLLYSTIKFMQEPEFQVHIVSF